MPVRQPPTIYSGGGLFYGFFPNRSHAKRQGPVEPFVQPRKKRGDLWGKGEWTGPGSYGTIFLGSVR